MSSSGAGMKLYGDKCAQLQEEPEIRFAGIVDKEGQLIAGGFKEGLTPHEDDICRAPAGFLGICLKGLNQKGI